MPGQELLLLASARSAPSRIFDLVNKCVSLIGSSGGVVTRLESMGVVPLGYPITVQREKHAEARGLVLRFEASEAARLELQRNLSTDLRVVRHLFTKNNDLLKMPDTRKIWKLNRELDARTRRMEHVFPPAEITVGAVPTDGSKPDAIIQQNPVPNVYLQRPSVHIDKDASHDLAKKQAYQPFRPQVTYRTHNDKANSIFSTPFNSGPPGRFNNARRPVRRMDTNISANNKTGGGSKE